MKGNVKTVGSEGDGVTGWDAHFEGTDGGLVRLEDLIELFVEPTHHGEQLGDLEPVELVSVAESAWDRVAADGVDLSIQTDQHVRADEEKLATMLERLFRNAVERGEAWHVTLGELGDGTGFYVEDDGVGVSTRREEVFRRGITTVGSRTGLGIAICAPIAESHGWSLSVTESRTGGARVEVSDVDLTTTRS